MSRARSRSRSGAKTLATHAQLADAVWQDTSTVLVLANEAAADTVTHDTLVQMNGSCVQHLATKVAGILGGHIVGPNLMILNHRALGDKYCQPSHNALQRSLHAALRAADGQIVLWTGQYHSRLFDRMERQTGMGFSWLMQVARISRLSDAVDMDEIVSGALQRKTVWGANAIKAAIIRGALHIAVRVHLSYETPASVRLRADFPAMIDQLRAPVHPAPKQASVVEAFIAKFKLQQHAADHLRVLSPQLQVRVMEGGLEGARVPSAALMFRMSKWIDTEPFPRDVEKFVQTYSILPRTAHRLRFAPPRLQQQVMSTSLSSAKDATSALAWRLDSMGL